MVQTYGFLGYLQTLLYYPYYFWILELFVCGLDTLFILCPFETKRGSICYLRLGLYF
jgi:hypothetical protein